MARKRKSREEKMKADNRHFNYHFEATSTPKPQISISDSPSISHIQTATVTHPYLKHDLSRTLILTASILAFQIITFFILKIHTFPFLGIKY